MSRTLEKRFEHVYRYKQALLGDAAGGGDNNLVLPDDPRRVIVQKLALVVEGRPDEELDLTIGLDEIKKTVRPFFISPTVHHDDTKSWKLRHYLFIQSYISGQPTSRINYCIVKQS